MATSRASFPRRGDFMKDDPRRLGQEVQVSTDKGEKLPVPSDFVLKIGGDILDNNTVMVDTHSLIDQKTHDTDLARWEDTVKKHHSQRLPSLPQSHPGDDVRLIDYERRREQEEERMRRHEIEMMRWREEMRRYHMEIKRLQEDSRRYRAG